MVSSTLASDTDLGGALRAPSEASPDESHGQSQPSKGGGLARDAVRRLLRNKLALATLSSAVAAPGGGGAPRRRGPGARARRGRESAAAGGPRGAGARRVLARHIVPNALTPIVVAVTFGIPEAIFTEAALSFIGVGINPPTPSWGQMVGEGQQYIRSYWHLCVFPSIAIAITMLSFTFFGDGVRDALDPKLK